MTKGDATMAEWLKDGLVLCCLANCCKPGSARRVSNRSSPRLQKDNIKKFLALAEDWGVEADKIFDVDDLYEEKNLPLVLETLRRFKKAVEGKSAADVTVRPSAQRRTRSARYSPRAARSSQPRERSRDSRFGMDEAWESPVTAAAPIRLVTE